MCWGSRAGTDVVQFYASHRATLVTRPAQELVGFGRVDLRPGQSADVTVRFSTGQIADLGSDMSFIFDPGAIEIMVGASSDDIPVRGSVEAVGLVANWSNERRAAPAMSTRGDNDSEASSYRTR